MDSNIIIFTSLWFATCVLLILIYRLWGKLSLVRAEKATLQEISKQHQERIGALSTILVAEKKRAEEAENILSNAQRKQRLAAERDSWCDSRLLEFLPGVPEGIHRMSLGHAKYCMTTSTAGFYELRDQSNLKKPGQWELYWCLARASRAAIASSATKVEDGITGDFVQGLEREAQKLPALVNEVAPSLQMVCGKIYEQARPAAKESDVGADLLLIIAGNNLVPGGGARLFWLQAKKARDGANPYSLDCSYENNIDFQINTLRKVHSPSKGSFSAYIQYSSVLGFIPSFCLSAHTPSPDLRVDLSSLGVRLPELITAYASIDEQGIGSFADPVSVTRYLASVTAGRPLFVVAATESSDKYLQKWSARQLVNEIQSHYQRGLGVYRERENEKNLDNGPEISF